MTMAHVLRFRIKHREFSEIIFFQIGFHLVNKVCRFYRVVSDIASYPIDLFSFHHMNTLNASQYAKV